MNIIVICLALLVYGSTLVNHMVYYHSHITSEGKFISHAHPFNKSQDKSPIKTHHHSSIDLLLLFGDGLHQFSILHHNFKVEPTIALINACWLDEMNLLFFVVVDKQRGPPQLYVA